MAFYGLQRSSFSTGLNNNSLVLLIAINLTIFIIFAFVKVFYLFTYVKVVADVRFINDIYSNLALPADFNDFIRKPWTLITHMFYHDRVWHLVGNILWLWMFGYIFQDLTGMRKIIPVYIFGALGGAIAFLLAYNLIPALKGTAFAASGASAGIMAIVVATTMVAPNYRIFPMINGGIPLWVLTIIFLIIDLGLLSSSNTGGHIAHLAGALVGYLYIRSVRKGSDWSDVINKFFDWVNNLFNPDKTDKTIKEQLFYKSGRTPFSKSPNLTQQRIDDILDKINQKGYDSLTSEEKELLKRASREDL